VGLKIHVDHADDLQLITALVHDGWFDLALVAANPQESRIDIPIERQRGRTHVKSRMIIDNVKGHTIRDTERVGRYDFNTFHFDATNGTLGIRTGIPLEFIITVNRLSVRLEDD
jgi:hypothetical protein